MRPRVVLLVGASTLLCPMIGRSEARSSRAVSPGHAPQASQSAPAQTTFAGGTISGAVLAGKTPLPGVAITATNTLTGKRYATTTDLNGRFQMAIPKTGRYVVRAELAAFAPLTAEVKLTAEATAQTTQFVLELASRAAATQAAAGDPTGNAVRQIASALSRGTQNLSLSGESGLEAATVGNSGDTSGVLPTGTDLASGESITYNGAQGTTNGLAGLSEDQVRDRINDITSQIRAQGGNASDGLNGAASVLAGIMQGGGFGGGGRGGGGGGRGGGGGGRGGGGGGFRGFDPATPHGSLFYVGGFPALQAQRASASSLLALSEGGTARSIQPALSSQQNRFGVSFTGSPYLPHLTKPNPTIFTFFNLTGQRNITPQNFTGTVPTAAERTGDLSALAQTNQNGTLTTPIVYNPMTGMPFQNNRVPVTPQAAALLALYPLPNFSGIDTQNYQTITTAGSNSLQGSLRFVENFGKAANQGIGGFLRSARNGPPTLRQNINVNFSFSHNASDQRNIIPILGGKTATDGYNLAGGYTIGYGRLVNNATLTWNRSSTVTRNFFTGTNNFAGSNGISVPNNGAQLPQPGFYDGVPSISLSNFTSLTDTVPRDSVNQTISFSDFVSYSHKKHNMRYGLDLRRVHADQEGGNNPLGQFSFSGLVTESCGDQQLTLDPNSQNPAPPCPRLTTSAATTGSSLADFLLGLPQQSTIQAGLFKTYLRANIFDAYAQDDFRIRPNVTLNYGLRYEYFSPYFEKNNRLVNLDTNAAFTAVDPVQPGQTGTFSGGYPRSLVNPDRDLFSPRFGIAWRPKLPTKALSDIVIRAGYGINFNTGQYATFAQSLAFQPPFAATENNTLSTYGNPTGCTLGQAANQPGGQTAQNLTLANGFSCATKPITNTYAVDKNYRLGHVQVYNVDVQKSLPHGVVLNLGYNGSKGGDLDVLLAPNALVSSVSTANAQAFTYEDSQAESRLQQLTVSARKRLEKGVSVQFLYVYSHSIDDASSIGSSGTSSTVQNSRALYLEESNSSFDIRHALTGNYVYELPFGPNRRFLSKGGRVSKVFDGFNISGDFTFRSGTYFTPQYQDTAAELAAGGTYTLRPDRVVGQAIQGARTIGSWFNTKAFMAPQNGFGTSSRNSIEGPGTVQANMSLSRTIPLGEQRTFEARFTGTNIFNTVQYSGIGTTVNVATYGQVTSIAAARVVTLTARYRF